MHRHIQIGPGVFASINIKHIINDMHFIKKMAKIR